MSQGCNVVGTRPIRPDGYDKVTGRAVYGADFHPPGLLHAAFCRSPHAHARIVRIEIGQALALPGVKAVVTAEDFPPMRDRSVQFGENDTPLEYLRGNVLAMGKVLYRGHAVAAVAANSVHDATEAAKRIVVEYEVLPSVFDVREAMKASAPTLHEELRMVEFQQRTAVGGNVAEHFRSVLGSTATGFAEADVVVEREFDTVAVHQGYIEPNVATALWNSDGRVLIWSSTQGAFGVRDVTAAILDVKPSAVMVSPLEIGGGFGGKIPVYLEPVVALLSKKTGRPVKLVMTRREVFEATGPAPGSHIKVKMGATKEGRISAAEAWLAYEAGAYPGAMVGSAGMTVFAAYDIPNVVIDGFDVVVNKPSTSPYRAPGAPNAAFAAETVVDELAEKLGVDPLGFRLLNAAREGTRRAQGSTFGRIGCIEVLNALRSHPHYSSPVVGERRGRGVAIGFWFNSGLQSSSTVAVNADGTVCVVDGSTGIGGTRSSVAMQVAEVLGLRATDVFVSVKGTSRNHPVWPQRIRGIYLGHWRLARNSCYRLGCFRGCSGRPPTVSRPGGSDVGSRAGGGCVRLRSVQSRRSRDDFRRSRCESTGGRHSRGRQRHRVHARGRGSFAGCIVDVEVDAETGKVSVLRFTAVQDADRAIHPSYWRGRCKEEVLRVLVGR